MSILFLVPARGGSKGFPGKNVALLTGIPLVGRAARTACQAAAMLGGDCRVVCSTDDPAIAEAARAWGAEIPFTRPAELASDTARSIDVVFHALDALRQRFDAVVLMQPTSPLTSAEDVVGAIRLHRGTAAPVVSVCEAEHPIEWLYRMLPEGILQPVLQGNEVHQRQASSATFLPNGAIYVASPETLRRVSSFMTEETRGFVMPHGRSVDIDRPRDLALANSIVEADAVAPIEIGGKAVGPGQPCFVIAEAGVNHNGDIDLALRLVDAAAAAGADAVKFQTFKADRLVTVDARKAAYQVRGDADRETQREMLARMELTVEHHRVLMARCADLGILFLSTPFEEESADLLEALRVEAFKLPSGELTNLPFLAHVARKGRPLIVSTGMSILRDVDAAVGCCRRAGATGIALLQCVSEYPADAAAANLRAMDTMRNLFSCPVGFSDHTQGISVATAAAALGANIIEKHFTLDRTLPGPDHHASLEPDELSEMVRAIRVAQSALGDGNKRIGAGERAVALAARKSLVAGRDIPAGTVIGLEHLVTRRPGTGVSPASRDQVLGRRARIAIAAGTVVTWEMLA